MNRLLQRYKQATTLTRALTQALASAVVFYGGALLEGVVQDAAKDEASPALIRAAAIFVLLIVFISGVLILRGKLSKLEQQDASRRRQLAYAANLTDQLVGAKIERLAHASATSWAPSTAMQFALDDIKHVVEQTYHLFASEFATAERAEDRIAFEVTFMTKSFADAHITIPASANRDHRAPVSMGMRAQRPDIYKDTETAKLYREVRPTMRIIEDTVRPEQNYAEVYAGQKSRIRSSIVYPVLSDANRLLGTLVVHCDRPCFFLHSEEAHWRELLEIFAKRLALEKARLDFVVEHRDQLGATDLPLPF